MQWLEWLDKLIAPAILVAVIGWFAKFYLDWKLERKKTKLNFLSDQIKYLYGPLTAITRAGNEAVRVFLESRGRSQEKFFDHAKISVSDLEGYRNWIKAVAQPNNLKMEKLILDNMHLFVGGELTKIYADFLAHVSLYKELIATWDGDPISAWPKSRDGKKVDYNQMPFDQVMRRITALRPFPSRFHEENRIILAKLRTEQDRILRSLF
jgi:hypothetical protein